MCFSAQGQMGNIAGPGAIRSLSLLLTAARVALTGLWTYMWLCANKTVGESRRWLDLGRGLWFAGPVVGSGKGGEFKEPQTGWLLGW